MTSNYAQQAALVIKAIPLIAKEDVFALKGGTAINLFELDMPRLSVDIDLTFTRITDRETAIVEINEALDRISKDLARFGIPNRLPRDLFDVAQFYKTSTITDEIKSGFLALALGHNRPLHELLNPTLQDHEDIFNQQFAGMSDTPFSYQEHKDTFARLHEELLGSLTNDDKQHLLDFVSLQGQPEDFGIPHLAELPAIIWKRKNLETLRQANPAKFAEQRKLLETLLAQS